MSIDPYKKLNIEITQAREQFSTGEISVIEFERILKSLYEESLKMESKKKIEDHKELLKLIFAT